MTSMAFLEQLPSVRSGVIVLVALMGSGISLVDEWGYIVARISWPLAFFPFLSAAYSVLIQLTPHVTLHLHVGTALLARVTLARIAS